MGKLRALVVIALGVASGVGLTTSLLVLPSSWEREAAPAPSPVTTRQTTSVAADTPQGCGKIKGVPEIGEAPLLRVERGEHAGLIAAMAMAPDGRTIITGGWDKTVRVWSLATADGKPRTTPELRDILTVPVGRGRTGEAYAIAVSPDESLIAVGGRMASEGKPEAERIYIFDAVTARIAAVLPVASQVAVLAWSPDGRHLAAGTDSAAVGLCVWSAGSWKLAGHDKAYGGPIRGLSFSADGRLAATSFDGRLRLYADGFAAPAQRHDFPADAAAGQPAGVTFSPNGRYLAVGFFGARFVSVHDASNLNDARRLEPAAAAGEQPFVAWSSNGRLIYAAGAAQTVPGSARARTVLQSWTVDQTQPLASLATGPGTRQLIDGASGPVQAVASLPGGGVAFVSRDGDIAGQQPDGTLAFRRSSTRIDWRVTDSSAIAKDFRLSADASRVSIRLADGRTVRFDVARRNTSPRPFIGATGSDEGLAGPEFRLAGRGISLADPARPVIASTAGTDPIEWAWLGEGERAASHAASNVAGAFVLGTNHRLRIADASGNERGSIPVPETVERVMITRDGRLVVAAIADGTLRWYRIGRNENSDRWTLEELLALYLHDDGRRWIAWTRNGHYDAAAGGEELINWQVNRGPDRNGLNFSVGRFRDLYRRSDIIDRALTTASAAPDASLFIARSPPVIRITGWQQLPNFRLQLAYEVDWLPGATPDLGQVTAFIDGSSQQARGVSAVETGRTVLVDVPPGMVARRVEVRANTREGQASDPAMVELPTLAAPPPTTRRLHAVVVGVSGYGNLSASEQLQFADDDARVFAALVQAQAGPGRLYESVVVNPKAGRPLTDADATRERILNELRAVETGPQDLAILFLAGHGTVWRPENEGGETSLFLPHDARTMAGRVDPASAISVSEITQAFFNERNRGRKLVFIDACRSGNFARNNGNLLATAMKDNRADVAVWSAATAEQLAFESAKYGGGHGAFTMALIEAFRGKPDFTRILENPARFSEGELNLWIERRVPSIAGLGPDGNPRQTPERLLAGVGGDIATIVP